MIATRAASIGLGAMAIGVAAGACTPATSAGKAVTLEVALRGDHYRLANGLEVVLHEDRSLRDVIVDVRYHVGSKDDPPGRSGFAHLFEHLMFLGSRHVTEGSFTKTLDEAGAVSYNAFTTHDATEYHEVVPPAELPIALFVEADRMAYPADRVEAEALRRERDVVKNEWRERYDNAPYGHVWSIVRAALFEEGHPYHRPPIGSPADLDRASVDDARAFGARFYNPSNATLVIAGDFDRAEARGLVERLFAAIPAGPAIAPRRVAFPTLTAERRVVVEADVATPRVIVSWTVPPPHARGWDEIHLAARSIAGMTEYKLQVQSKIARSVEWDVAPGRLGSMLSFVIDLEPGASPDAAVDALETRVKWLSHFDRVGAYTWEGFAGIRTQRMTSCVFGLATLRSRAEHLQDYVEVLGYHDGARDELRRIQAIRSADAATAAEELLVDRPKVVVVVEPTPGAPRSGRVSKGARR